MFCWSRCLRRFGTGFHFCSNICNIKEPMEFCKNITKNLCNSNLLQLKPKHQRRKNSVRNTKIGWLPGMQGKQEFCLNSHFREWEHASLCVHTSGVRSSRTGLRREHRSPGALKRVLTFKKKVWKRGDIIASSSTVFRSLHLFCFPYKSEFPSEIFWWPSSFSYKFCFSRFSLSFEAPNCWPVAVDCSQILPLTNFVHHSFCCPKALCKPSLWLPVAQWGDGGSPHQLFLVSSALTPHGRIMHQGNSSPMEKI